MSHFFFDIGHWSIPPPPLNRFVNPLAETPIVNIIYLTQKKEYVAKQLVFLL
jgi:hypothetical protein